LAKHFVLVCALRALFIALYFHLNQLLEIISGRVKNYIPAALERPNFYMFFVVIYSKLLSKKELMWRGAFLLSLCRLDPLGSKRNFMHTHMDDVQEAIITLELTYYKIYTLSCPVMLELRKRRGLFGTFLRLLALSNYYYQFTLAKVRILVVPCIVHCCLLDTQIYLIFIIRYSFTLMFQSNNILL
jgi:hypothetical protein